MTLAPRRLEAPAPAASASPSCFRRASRCSGVLSCTVGLRGSLQVVQCCGLPALAQEGHSLHRTFQLAVSLKAPPGGWLGPFGFFRLVTYTFLAGSGLSPASESRCAVFELTCRGVLLALLLALLASSCSWAPGAQRDSRKPHGAHSGRACRRSSPWPKPKRDRERRKEERSKSASSRAEMQSPSKPPLVSWAPSAPTVSRPRAKTAKRAVTSRVRSRSSSGLF